ncbi:MAG: Tm-1-like ATP-binding domain-containing protein [Clostridium sp.]
MAKTIALIASLDTKKKETLYAASVIQKQGFSTYIIDISTKNLVDGADITPVEILKRYGIEWEDFDPLGKAASIDVMSKAAAFVLPQLYAEGKFDVVISIGGGQNAKMAAMAMKNCCVKISTSLAYRGGMWRQDIAYDTMIFVEQYY